ncbi:MAG: A/G-specific adenine glycosylase [Flavobacteriales bacterium]
MKSFSKTLTDWYQINKRDLPWRHTRNPYPIWLSEVILQQTRVDQGMAYYRRFLELFPDIKALANASEDEVLKAWQGLGYYSRARNLHATSKIISELHGGSFPGSSAELLKLKGIGPYTAAAIASFAWNERVPVIDGNVMRVAARIFGLDIPVDTPAGRQQIEEILQKHIDPAEPGIFNQAIMEFGALQCVPANPECLSCVFNKACKAFNNDLVASLPIKSQKTKVKNLWLSFFHITWKNKVYIHRRTEKGIWQGLYDFPSVESQKKPVSSKVVDAFFPENLPGLNPTVESISKEYIHLLSHRKIHAVFYLVKLQKQWKNLPSHVMEINAEDLHQYGIPRLIDRYLNDMDN